MKSPRIVLAVVASLLVPAAAAVAQDRPVPRPQARLVPKKAPPRAKYFMAGASGQVSGDSISPTLSYPLFGEQAQVTGPVTLGHGAHLDAEFGMQLARKLTLGGRIGFSKSTGQSHETFTVPNPLFFDEPRTAIGSAPAHRSTFDIDVDLWYRLFQSKTWMFDVGGGPAFTRLSQQLGPDSFVWTETYPFTAITLQPSGVSSGSTGFGVGGHAGGRLEHPIGKKLSVLGEVRWRGVRTTVTLQTAKQTISSNGVLLGGGVKWIF